LHIAEESEAEPPRFVLERTMSTPMERQPLGGDRARRDHRGGMGSG